MRFYYLQSIRCASLFSLLLSATVCHADTVILKNADRLTGEIQKLEGKKLYLKTSYAGVVALDWDMVESVSSDREYRVETQSGWREVGILQPASEGVAIASGGLTSTVTKRSIVGISRTPQETGFWGRVDGGADLGASLARGNSRLNQASVTLGAEYREDKFRVRLDITSLFSHQAQAPATGDYMASMRWDRYLSRRLFTFALASVERDDRELLSLRTNLGGGLGWRITRSERTQLSLLLGGTYLNELFRQGAEVEGDELRHLSGEGLVGISLDRAQVGRANVTTKLTVYPSFLRHGRYRIAYESSIRVPFAGRLSWNVRLFDRFDSLPLAAVRRNDYGVVSGLGVAF